MADPGTNWADGVWTPGVWAPGVWANDASGVAAGQAEETDSAFGVTVQKTFVLGQVSETDSVLSLVLVRKTFVLDQVTEIDRALGFLFVGTGVYGRGRAARRLSRRQPYLR